MAAAAAAKPPTAILTDNHAISLGAMRAIYAAGLRIPDDISVVGYGVLALAASFAPPPDDGAVLAVHARAHSCPDCAVVGDTARHDSASASILPVALMQRASTAPLHKR